MPVKFKHSNLVNIIKSPYTGQTGYVSNFYPKQYYIKTDSCKTPIYYLNIHSTKISFDKFKTQDDMMDIDNADMDIKFNVQKIIQINMSDIQKMSDESDDYIITKEGHTNFGDIGTLITKYEEVQPMDKIILNEQIVKKGKEDPNINDRITLKKITGCKTGTIIKIKPSQVEVELINGYKKVFDVTDVFYQDIELDNNKFLQVNYINNGIIYGNYVNGEQVNIKLNDKSIKYKNVDISSEQEMMDTDEIDGDSDSDSDSVSDSNSVDYDYSDQYENEREQPELKSTFKDASHMEYTKMTMSKDDTETLDKIKRFIEVVKKKNECVIDINVYSIIEIYNTILSTLKEYLIKIDSPFKNKNNTFDNSIILYLVIAYNYLQLNGNDVCCIYNNYPGESGLDKYISFLIRNMTLNKLLVKVSKFNTKNAQTIFKEMKTKSKNEDDIINSIINCDNILRHVLNVGFSNLQELPVKCVDKNIVYESVALKPFYNIVVPGYTISDKKVEEDDIKKNKINYTEQEIDEHLKEARSKNYKEAQKHWQKLKDDLIKSKISKAKSTTYYEYKVEYTTLDELINETREYLKSKIDSANEKNDLVNIEGYTFIYNNLLNYNLKDVSNVKFIKLLKIFQQKLKDNYKNIYTKRILTDNYNKLKELKLTEIQKGKRKEISFLNNQKYTGNTVYNKYKKWFNTFLINNPQNPELPDINMNVFNNYFNMLIKKAQESPVSLRKEEEELSDMLNQLTINTSESNTSDSDSYETTSDDDESSSNMDMETHDEPDNEADIVINNNSSSEKTQGKKKLSKLQKLREKFKSDITNKTTDDNNDDSDTEDSQFDLKYFKKK